MSHYGVDDYSKELAADKEAAPNRKPGFYWVGWGQGYQIGRYEMRQWWLCGHGVPTDDQQSFDVVGPLNPMDSGLPASLTGGLLPGVSSHQAPVAAEPQSLTKALFGFDLF
jgi:hypothetical protein